MSVSKWAYEPEKCDGDFCPGRCDICNKCYETVNLEEEDDDELFTDREYDCDG